MSNIRRNTSERASQGQQPPNLTAQLIANRLGLKSQPDIHTTNDYVAHYGADLTKHTAEQLAEALRGSTKRRVRKPKTLKVVTALEEFSKGEKSADDVSRTVTKFLRQRPASSKRDLMFAVLVMIENSKGAGVKEAQKSEVPEMKKNEVPETPDRVWQSRAQGSGPAAKPSSGPRLHAMPPETFDAGDFAKEFLALSAQIDSPWADLIAAAALRPPTLTLRQYRAILNVMPDLSNEARSVLVGSRLSLPLSESAPLQAAGVNARMKKQEIQTALDCIDNPMIADAARATLSSGFGPLVELGSSTRPVPTQPQTTFSSEHIEQIKDVQELGHQYQAILEEIAGANPSAPTLASSVLPAIIAAAAVSIHALDGRTAGQLSRNISGDPVVQAMFYWAAPGTQHSISGPGLISKVSQSVTRQSEYLMSLIRDLEKTNPEAATDAYYALKDYMGTYPGWKNVNWPHPKRVAVADLNAELPPKNAKSARK